VALAVLSAGVAAGAGGLDLWAKDHEGWLTMQASVTAPASMLLLANVRIPDDANDATALAPGHSRRGARTVRPVPGRAFRAMAKLGGGGRGRFSGAAASAAHERCPASRAGSGRRAPQRPAHAPRKCLL